ncbi:MAG: BON domain-containing protein, partial [Devosia sp.]
MSGIFLRWGIPGFVTVVGGTAISIMMTGENIASDLTGRASEALANAEFGWASVSFDARDAVIAGTATTQRMIDAVVARVASVHGVRAVSSNVVLAEFVSPFPFEARIDGAGIAVSGGVPDETAHAEIVLRTAATTDALRLMSGAPDRAAWRAAVDYGLGYLDQFDQGEIRLADLELSISGRARSAEAYDALTDLGRAGAPRGVRVAALEIVPALASPFEWRASFDGSLVTVSGYAPNEAFARRLRTADLGGVPVSTSLVLASGAPPDFDRNALLLLENLIRLERGTGTISDGTISLAGAPADQEAAEAVRLAMAPAGATLTLDPPRVAEYELTAVRGGGVIALDGFVPDAATRDRLDGLENVDAAGLELARGAPERFDSAVDFALEALGHMSEGKASIRGSVVSLEGRAATAVDFTALETTIALGAPQGLILGKAEIKPPLADPFVWSAEKTGDGTIAIEGFVPSRKAREALRAAIPNLGADASTLADGNPADFESVARAALGVLPLLDTGRIAFDGELWSLSGAVDTPQKGFAAQAAFAAAGLGGPRWTYAVALPQPVAAAALPIIDPYVWRARKSADGKITLGGFVPAEAARKFFAGRAGEGAVDKS